MCGSYGSEKHEQIYVSSEVPMIRLNKIQIYAKYHIGLTYIADVNQMEMQYLTAIDTISSTQPATIVRTVD